MKAPAFQFYAAEYLADERVQLMSLEEEGVYIRLLSYCWREGSIPSDPMKLSRLCKGADVARMESVLDAFTPVDDDPTRLIHARLEKEREKQGHFRELQRTKGSNGAKKRWDDSRGHAPAIAAAIAPAINRPCPSDSRPLKPDDGSSSSSSTAVVPPKPPQTPPPDAEASPPEVKSEKKPKDDRPTSPEAIAIAKLFHRRLDTHWDEKEIKAYREGIRRGVITVAALEEIEPYYAAERAKGDGDRGGRHRRDLKTFLNNFSGELDRARQWEGSRNHTEKTPDVFRAPMIAAPEPPEHLR